MSSVDNMTANQTRRRADPVREGSPQIHDDKCLPYRPLDLGVDCARLVQILRAGTAEDALSCTLLYVTFAERPRYEALSYMWGDSENDNEIILLDGIKFSVGRNLWDALHYLRSHRSNDIPIWIDALCINQADVPERTRQLRIMRHIYSRACTVVVWLGKKYVEYQGNIGHTQSNEFFRPREREVDSPSSSNSKPKTAEHKKEQAMAKELSTDGYWDRLWIIQEITQAEGPRGFRIQVCFGRLAMRWDMFIRFITMHGCGERGPLRLDRQLKEKYAGGHSLKRLLQEHRGAKCKEPKDKIYGLVGLAADARGFPMDYSKTPFEVWIDTMEFMNKRNLLEEKEIVEFGCLVRSLLIEPNCTPLWQSLESFEPKASSTRLIEDMQSARVFHMRGYILGYVCYVGPSISSIVGDLNKIDEWEEYIQLNFKDELAGAYHDSNYLLEAIIGSSETQLTSTCSSNISTVRWRGDLGQPWYHSAYSFSINLMKEFNPGIEAAQKISSNPARGHIPGAPVLFQIYEPCGVSTPWKVGISTRLVQTGDLIYCVPGVKQVLIIRVHTIDESFAKLQIFGTGMVFDDVVGYKWDVERKDRRLTHETTEIKMDARTLFALLP